MRLAKKRRLWHFSGILSFHKRVLFSRAACFLELLHVEFAFWKVFWMLFKNHIKKKTPRANVLRALANTGALRRADILDESLSTNLFDSNQEERYLFSFFNTTRTVASPHRSSQFLPFVFIFALKILGMSSAMLVWLFANHTNVWRGVISLCLTCRGAEGELCSALTHINDKLRGKPPGVDPIA